MESSGWAYVPLRQTSGRKSVNEQIARFCFLSRPENEFGSGMRSKHQHGCYSKRKVSFTFFVELVKMSCTWPRAAELVEAEVMRSDAIGTRRGSGSVGSGTWRQHGAAKCGGKGEKRTYFHCWGVEIGSSLSENRFLVAPNAATVRVISQEEAEQSSAKQNDRPEDCVKKGAGTIEFVH
ncbi:unnamed protein product [Protopolystoma xenopodis]|uniref:Uncharacterized protein n=1 Tax=Protopolystoma xenopodis TaxID=117903 RepID=A0A448X9M3_9PLAT|nr:unnamed protein product [Protopolystoma xenopodis]